MQYGRLKPFPDFLNIVQPQPGQLSLVGTSKVMKSQVESSGLLLRCSQQ